MNALLDINHNDEYDAFVEKFKPKKTTDDCYTPPAVYDAVLESVAERVDLTGKRIVRPFYPGGDYENFPYEPHDVVIDNPPFSIVAQIVRYYVNRSIPFFIFAPALTLLSPCIEGCTYVVTDSTIIYENGANVKTAFISNLFGEALLMTFPLLKKRIEDAQKTDAVPLPKYVYPDTVLTPTMVHRFADVEFSVPKGQAQFVRQLESQKSKGKTIFGAGLFVSQSVAAEAKAAEAKAAQVKAEQEKYVWELSEREQGIIRQLSGLPDQTPLFCLGGLL